LGLLLALMLAGCAAAESEFPDDGPAPPVSRDAALSFVRKALTAGKSAADTKTLLLTVTDAEVTSFLRIRAELTRELQAAGSAQLDRIEGLEDLGIGDINLDVWRDLIGTGDDAGPRFLPQLRLGLYDPQVHFVADGRIIARGVLAVLTWERPVRLVIAPSASNGELVLDFVDGQIGRVRMPEFIFDLIGKGLAEVLLAGQAYAEITQIQVGSGTLTISGRYNR